MLKEKVWMGDEKDLNRTFEDGNYNIGDEKYTRWE